MQSSDHSLERKHWNDYITLIHTSPMSAMATRVFFNCEK